MTYKQRLCEYIRYENKWLLILFFLSCVAGVVFSIFIPILQSNLINSVEAKTISIIQILIVVLLSFVAIFLVSFTSILTPILMLKFQNKIKYSLMQSVKYASESFLSMAGTSGLYYGFGSISNDISFVAYPAILNISLSLLQVAVVLFFLSKIYFVFLYLSLIIIFVYVGFVLLSQKTYANCIKKIREKEPQLYENAHLIFSNAGTITQFGNPEIFFGKFDKNLLELKQLNERAETFLQIQKVMLDILKAVSFVSFVLISIDGISKQTMTIGSLILILAYIPILLQPLSKIQYFVKIKSWIAESEANYEEYKQNLFSVKLDTTKNSLSLNPNATLKLDNVCFSYEETTNEGEENA